MGSKPISSKRQERFVVRSVGFSWRGRSSPWEKVDSEAEFGWNRVTIRKGMHELRSGIICCDAFAARGRARAEEKLPDLLADIQDIAKGFSQTDPQFRNRRLYTRLTAEELRRQLIEQKGYQALELPTPRTLRTKLNDLGFHLTKVAKCKPKKRSRKPMRSSQK
jgi:hypothetical protein